ncbi:RNA-directed DNA polymerase from mobile element jockey [Araneus ventricosus]|uniref:RNA-directed DNA polymerase from mobile element jockey n=1 Tax=Araneus ventricosus TaxID=182803 RepID=A0A4Y2IXT0_ARAVE|nr:RNA-directed DNA polymerase from mobile element jockey [Araneus ventricosus]
MPTLFCTKDDIDKFVSAELPDTCTDLRFFQIVTKCMVHGPMWNYLYIQGVSKLMGKDLRGDSVESFEFKPKLSTTHQLLRATETISDGFENKEHTGAVFLDIQKAFDRVWLNGLIYKLINYNTPPPLIKLITSFLTNRKFTVRVNATLSKLRCIQIGVPQGAKLSPSLYSIFINDIPQKHNTTLCIYADDTAILAKNKNTRFITIALNKHIQELECWFHKWKIAINASKTEAVLFTKKRDNPKCNVIIHNSVIPWAQEAKYLGVIFNKRLTWNSHINFIKNSEIILENSTPLSLGILQ